MKDKLKSKGLSSRGPRWKVQYILLLLMDPQEEPAGFGRQTLIQSIMIPQRSISLLLITLIISQDIYIYYF